MAKLSSWVWYLVEAFSDPCVLFCGSIFLHLCVCLWVWHIHTAWDAAGRRLYLYLLYIGYSRVCRKYINVRFLFWHHSESAFHFFYNPWTINVVWGTFMRCLVQLYFSFTGRWRWCWSLDLCGWCHIQWFPQSVSGHPVIGEISIGPSSAFPNQYRAIQCFFQSVSGHPLTPLCESQEDEAASWHLSLILLLLWLKHVGHLDQIAAERVELASLPG